MKLLEVYSLDLHVSVSRKNVPTSKHVDLKISLLCPEDIHCTLWPKRKGVGSH